MGKTEALHHGYGPVLPSSGVSVPETTLKERRYGRRHRNGASWLAGKICPFHFDGTPVMQDGRYGVYGAEIGVLVHERKDGIDIEETVASCLGRLVEEGSFSR